jgi:hypothetical protein
MFFRIEEQEEVIMDIVLNNGEIVCIGGDARNLSIACQSGRLWITQPGDPNDYLVAPGENFIITRRGKIAVTAMSNASVCFTSPVEMRQPSRPWQVMTA